MTARAHRRVPKKDALLREGEHVMCAYAQPANGPGWANQPVWAVLKARDGSTREVCIQPNEQTATMLAAYDLCSAAHRLMTYEAAAVLRGARERGRR